MGILKLTKIELLERISNQLTCLLCASVLGEWGETEDMILEEAYDIIQSFADDKRISEELIVFSDLISGLLYLHGKEGFKGLKILIPKLSINRGILGIDI